AEAVVVKASRLTPDISKRQSQHESAVVGCVRHERPFTAAVRSNITTEGRLFDRKLGVVSVGYNGAAASVRPTGFDHVTERVVNERTHLDLDGCRDPSRGIRRRRGDGVARRMKAIQRQGAAESREGGSQVSMDIVLMPRPVSLGGLYAARDKALGAAPEPSGGVAWHPLDGSVARNRLVHFRTAMDTSEGGSADTISKVIVLTRGAEPRRPLRRPAGD